MRRLSIDNRTEDVPAVIRGTFPMNGRKVAVVIVPESGTIMLASFKVGDDTAPVVIRTDGKMPSFLQMKPKPADRVLADMRKLSKRATAPHGASLRGRWSGSIRKGSSGHPVVTLTRKVGQAMVSVSLRDAAGAYWDVTTSMAETWKGGPARAKVWSPSSASTNTVRDAFDLAGASVRRVLGRLHGESDRRQAHDAAYAKMRPTKYSGAPKDPLDGIRLERRSRGRKPAAASGGPSASRVKSKLVEEPTQTDWAVVVRASESGPMAHMNMKIRRTDEGLYNVHQTLIEDGHRKRRKWNRLTRNASMKLLSGFRRRCQDRKLTPIVHVPKADVRREQPFFKEATVLFALGQNAAKSSSSKVGPRASSSTAGKASKRETRADQAKAAKKRTQAKRAARKKQRESGKAAKLTQAQKDDQLAFLVSKAIKDALRPGGVR